jgi:DNA-binding CsgD family transcriptional regulator
MQPTTLPPSPRGDESDDDDFYLDIVLAWSQRHDWSLTGRETEILAALIAGRPRAELAARLGVREATVKALVNRLLRKTEHASPGDAAIEILREALLAHRSRG